ncbi:GAF and ANTAR domain-containing protein [Micromonospora sp. PSH03]|uniref:GAF and ANTAR domain-containing protein n=1 Tax=Micromonospora salmantinae TaxID=2911211 RepID=UPI001EE7B5D6|nr:GAF and ANTAR domain-containing protein [Micromonospora salmantinae]MCG5457454.1 GAF and ANTAR domain-containing protein [Micromonospora salmantinae]
MAGSDSGAGTDEPRPAAVDDLAAKLSDLARRLQHEDSVEATLQAIAGAAVGTVPGAEQAALSVVEHRREIHTRAGTSDLVYAVDRVQYEVGEGPCLSAVYEQQTVHVPDMTVEGRWPRFTQRAAELGVSSMLSFQLYVQDDNLGALNLYSSRTHAFDDDSAHVGLLFAAHAAVAMSGAQHLEQLNQAISVRDVIGQAKGILMERHKLTADQAFAVLARASQNTNRKLVDVARYLTATGQLTHRTPR